MTWENIVAKQEQDQKTYENNAEARRVTLIGETGTNVGTNNPLPVNLASTTSYTAHREQGTALVTHNTETTLVSYTVPSENKFILTGVNWGGEADGEFAIYVNTVRTLVFRNSAANRTQYITLSESNFELAGDDIIDVKVTNVSHRKNAANYEAIIIGGII